MPDKVVVEKANDFHGVFEFKPLEKGYGVTIGNALRRILLSSLEGYTITSVKFPGVLHEFSSIEGVVEDVTEIILNLKMVRFKKISDMIDGKITVNVKKQSVLTAGDISKFSASFEVLNPDLVICHLDDTRELVTWIDDLATAQNLARIYKIRLDTVQMTEADALAEAKAKATRK